jgi:hypothetical protein
MTRALLLSAGFCLLAARLLAIEPPSSGKIDFTRDIRPILSNHCYHCHGNDEKERKAKLRLDTKEGLFSKHEDVIPFMPGSLEKSEGWLRIVTTDKDDIMPPPESHRALNTGQIALIKRWIEQGTPYKEHWAYAAPVRPALPQLQNAWWARNDLDRFIAAELEARKLQPNAEAPKELLLRRVSFDLTGLPPTPAEADAFLADTAPDAYERAVDRLLASPRFGEEMARHWLDLARYGDTHGLHLDNERLMYPYRDWVVRAFNVNVPYDQFTIEQLAGDLLPNATRDQLIASGFNRCNVTTSEGGAINEEFLFRYAVDRTETAVAVWMGLTAGCAVCHDHKFDPISQKEFYSMYSFFNSAADPAMDGNAMDTPPILRLTTPAQEQALGAIESRQKETEKQVDAVMAKLSYTDPATLSPLPPPRKVDTVWLEDEFPADAKVSASGHPAKWVTAEAGGPVQSGKRALQRTGEGIIQDYFDGAKAFYVPTKGRIYAYVYLDPKNPPKAVMLQWHSEGQWQFRANWGDENAITFGKLGTPEKVQVGPLPKLGEWVRLEVNIGALKLKPGQSFDGLAFTQYGGNAWWDHTGVTYEEDPATDPQQSQIAWEKANQGKIFPDKEAKELSQILRSVKPQDRTPAQQEVLNRYYLTKVCSTTRGQFATITKEREKMDAERKQLEGQVEKTLIMRDLEQRRPSFVMVRGQYDKPGDPVKPGTPAVFPPLGVENPSRLDFAKWLVSPQHPLTARVAVNRCWQQFFGTGLVKTAGDFGAQGDPPSHPELLDWLAVDFRDHGWDMKRLVKMIVTSAAYRQDSRTTPEKLEADPENRLLARGPRFRLDAEQIRDNALFVSGLIDLTIGGKPVKPYQPERIWEPVGFVGSNTREYKQDHAGALYRRSLYTFWKRTAPPPNMMIFDTPSREQYCTRRERSNTPLQALVTMNDVQQFEAARALAERMLSEGGLTPADRIGYGFRIVLSRRPRENERDVLKQLFEKELTRYAGNADAATQVTAYGESKSKANLPAPELAAYTLVANVLLNMDETLNKN